MQCHPAGGADDIVCSVQYVSVNDDSCTYTCAYGNEHCAVAFFGCSLPHFSIHIAGAVTVDAVTLTGVKSYVLRYWEEELELRIGRNELGHRYYTPFDIQLFLKINELKSKGLQLKAIRTLIPPEVRKTDTPDFSESYIRILEGEAVELEDTPMKNKGSEKEFMEKAESGNTEKCGADNDKILEFQEIMERLIREEMQRKKEGEYRCRSLDEAIRRQQQARREAAASCEGKKNKRNRKGCR